MRSPLSSLLRALPSSAIWRVRFITLLVTLLGLATVVPPTLAAHESLELRLAGTVTALALGAYWIAGFRRGHFRAALELVEVAAVFIVMYACPVDPVLPLFAVMFRAQYSSPLRGVPRAAVYIAILHGVHVLHGAQDLQGEAGKILGIGVGGLIAASLGMALGNYEASERRLRSVVENSTDVLAILRPDLTIKWHAATVRSVLGFEPQSLLNRSLPELLQAEDGAAFARLVTGLAPEASGTLTVRLCMADGQVRVVAATAINRLDDPYMQGILVNLRDETERRRLEHERRELDLLRERVEAQREKHELEAKLQRAQRLETVGQLAGGIAHDFNNLLAVIQNYAEFIREELGPESELQPDVAEIERAAERGARLTRQLLMFSQRKATAPEVLDLNGVVAGMQALLRRSVGEHVELREELEEGLADVEIDPVSVEQVVMNLVVNARDAVGAGGRVAVSTETVVRDAVWAVQREIAPGRYVRLTVSDDGKGMDDATLASALQPFFTTKPAGEGTGLGLATVDGIASRAGGCVTIESEVGRGTSVHVYLPVTDRPRAGAVVDLVRTTPTGPATGTVLVVEDEAPVRALVARILTKAGYRVTTAPSGAEALDLEELQSSPPDLLLTDMVMPGMSGWELAQALRVRRPTQRVVFMSGYSEQLLRQHGPTPAEVISKPFSADVLLRYVREALEAPGIAQPAADPRAHRQAA